MLFSIAMFTLKNAVRPFIPPIVYQGAARLRKTHDQGYAYVPRGWQEAANYKGWNADTVLAAYQATWPRLVCEAQTTHPLNVVMGSDDATLHNILLCFAYSLTLAGAGKSIVSFLDWGGAIGQYNLLAQAVLPDTEIDYYCKDVPLLAAYGQTLHPDAHFMSDENCLERTYDFVLASSSLQYSEDWQEILTKLARAIRGYFLLTRCPVHDEGASYVFSQSAYGSEWLGWSFNRNQILNCVADAGLILVREFVMSNSTIPITNAPCPSQQRGFLFRRKEAA